MSIKGYFHLLQICLLVLALVVVKAYTERLITPVYGSHHGMIQICNDHFYSSFVVCVSVSYSIGAAIKKSASTSSIKDVIYLFLATKLMMVSKCRLYYFIAIRRMTSFIQNHSSSGANVDGSATESSANQTENELYLGPLLIVTTMIVPLLFLFTIAIMSDITSFIDNLIFKKQGRSQRKKEKNQSKAYPTAKVHAVSFIVFLGMYTLASHVDYGTLLNRKRIWHIYAILSLVCFVTFSMHICRVVSQRSTTKLLLNAFAIVPFCYLWSLPLEYDLTPSGIKVLEHVQSVSGTVSVFDDTITNQGTDFKVRVMRVDHSLVGGEYPDYQSSIYDVFLIQANIIDMHATSRKNTLRTLTIGLGVGVVCGVFQQEKMYVDVVELDPVVVDTADKHFSFFTSDYPHGKIYTMDALEWMSEQKEKGLQVSEKYDLIVHDVFSAGGVPSFLFTQTFFDDLMGILRSEGILAVNIFANEAHNGAGKLILNTLSSRFKHVIAYGEELSKYKENVARNIVFFCSSNPIEVPQVLRFPGSRVDLSSWDIDVRNTVSSDNHALLNELQQKSNAVPHYAIMNTVFDPEIVWLPLA